MKTSDETIFEELAELLSQERRAISGFDALSLRRLTEQKLAMLARLRLHLQQEPGALQRAAASRALIEAEANHALLRDTLSTLSECLGVRPASLYDQRARLSSSSAAQTVQCSA